MNLSSLSTFEFYTMITEAMRPFHTLNAACPKILGTDRFSVRNVFIYAGKKIILDHTFQLTEDGECYLGTMINGIQSTFDYDLYESMEFAMSLANQVDLDWICDYLDSKEA